MTAPHAPRAVRSLLTVAVFAGGALACDSPKDKPAPAPSAPPVVSAAPVASAAPVVSAPPPAPSAPASALPVKCKDLLSDAALLRVAAGFSSVDGKSECPACGPQCNLVNKGKPFEGAMVSYACDQPLDKARMDGIVAPLKKTLKKSEPVKGFGRGGIHGEKENGMFYEVVAFDDDTNCVITVDWMRGNKKSTLELAQIAAAEVKKAMVVAPQHP
jgi:hypothetical protein